MPQRVQHHRRGLLLLSLLALRIAARAARELLKRSSRCGRECWVAPEAERRLNEFPRVIRLRSLAGIERVRVERLLRDPPAPAPRRRVEPARVVPAADVRRV